MKNRSLLWACGCTLLLQSLLTTSLAKAQPANGLASPQPESSQDNLEDSWLLKPADAPEFQTRTRELTLYPQAEPRPALKYQFLPDAFETLPGNSAIYYLKALGFLEQHNARDKLTQVQQDAVARARREDKEIPTVAPFVWVSTPPQQLPVEEVKEYLSLTSFQTSFLREAAARLEFKLDRNIRGAEDLIGYLLPEIQNLRELARTNSIRCRLAIAENRTEDALEIVGQQFALGHHLGQDDFYVSNLVGIAIASIGWNDLLYLLEQPETPNLYWAIASLPKPLVSMERAAAVERQILYQQIRPLQEVTEELRPVGYWQDFLDRISQHENSLNVALPNSGHTPQDRRSAMVAMIAASYPSAKAYLIDELGMPLDVVEAYPTAQAVFLAAVRFYDQWRDEFFKWKEIPFWQVQQSNNADELAQRFNQAVEQAGWFAQLAKELLPATYAIQDAQLRVQQQIAMAQTVEAIRMYAAAHAGQLPPTLQDLDLPAPVDPATAQNFQYQLEQGRGVLTGDPVGRLQTRLIIRLVP